MSLKIIKRLAEIAKEEFKDIVTDTEILHAVRLRLELVDGSTVDILYPMREKYSFHWRQEDKVFRINTAPHHPQIASFPRRMHYENEERIIEDAITSSSASPEENLRRVLKWIRENLKKGN